jgi:hypothetical protein
LIAWSYLAPAFEARLQGRQYLLRPGRQFGAREIACRNQTARYHDTEYAAPELRPIADRPGQVCLQPDPEAVDENARRFEDRSVRQPPWLPASASFQGQPFQVQSDRRDVFAKFAGTQVVSEAAHLVEEFARNQMDLAEVREAGPFPGKIPVPYE